MANKRLVSSDILNVELTNKFLLKDTTLRLNNSTQESVSLDLNTNTKSGSSLALNQNTNTNSNTNSNSNSNSNSNLNQNTSLNPNSNQKIFIPLDGTEIRKEFTSKSEKLDKVRALDGKIISGYHSYSTVAVEENSHKINILEIKPFSTKEEDYLSKNKIVLDLIDSTLEGLKNLSNTKVFLLDREFDSQTIISHFCKHPQQPKFIIRAKHLNREFKEGKLNQIKFPKATSFKIQELQIKAHKYQNLTLKLFHKKLTLVNDYEEEIPIIIVKAKLLDNQKQPIFKTKDQDFYLITNQEITTKEELYQCYLNYFIRWKIETVFKFLKDVLGLETFRIEDLKGIKNLISLTFLIGSYLNNLTNLDIDQEFLIWLSKLGDGDGKVTNYYLKQGLQKIANYTEVNMFFKRNKIHKTKQDQLLGIISW